MKTLKLVAAVIVLISIVSCGGNSKNAADAASFEALEDEMKGQFGDDAYYTDLSVLYIKGIGNTISVTVTEEPESLKMGQWDWTQDTWTQRSEISLEVPEGTNASDYMFQLNDQISLAKLGGLVEKSIQQLKEEKDLKNPILSVASVNFPDTGERSKAKYAINLEPENGGTTFSFYYTLDGEFIEMDY